MKSRLAVLLILTAIGILAVSLFDGKQNRYSELCISWEQMEEIVEDREPAENTLCSRIVFNEYELMYDKEKNRFFYSLVAEDDSSYDPYVEYAGPEQGVEMAIVGGSISDEMIARGEEHTILFYTEDSYETYSLAFTTLPLLSIDYEGEMEQYGTKQMQFKLFDNRSDATQRVIRAEGEVRYRGRYTRNYPKIGYRMTLYTQSPGANRREYDVSLLGMRQDGDWILYAGYNDQEKIRNVFSSNLWKDSCATNNSCGVDNGMEYRYVELFVKGQYWGLYALGYPIDSLQLQMTDNEYMYNKIDPDQSEIEIDYDAEGPVPGYEIKELGVNREESWEPLKKYYKAMLSGDEDYTELRQYADLSNSMDIFLFLNLIQGIDHANLRGRNVIFNLYMTNKLSDDGQSEVMLYTPWDMDRTWGNGFEDKMYNVPVEQNVVMQSNIVYLLLEQGDEEIREELLQRYTQLREGVWSEEKLMERLTLYEQQIFDSGAYKRDKLKWPNGNYIGEENKLSIFKGYVLERLKYMDLFVGQYN